MLQLLVSFSVSTSTKQAALAATDAALKKRRSRSHLNNKSNMLVWWLCHIKKVQFTWIFSGFSAKLILGCLLVFVHSVLLFSVDKKKVSVFEEHRSLSFGPHPCPYIDKVIKLKYLAFSRKKNKFHQVMFNVLFSPQSSPCLGPLGIWLAPVTRENLWFHLCSCATTKLRHSPPSHLPVTCAYSINIPLLRCITHQHTSQIFVFYLLTVSSKGEGFRLGRT